MEECLLALDEPVQESMAQTEFFTHVDHQGAPVTLLRKDLPSGLSDVSEPARGSAPGHATMLLLTELVSKV